MITRGTPRPVKPSFNWKTVPEFSDPVWSFEENHILHRGHWHWSNPDLAGGDRIVQHCLQYFWPRWYSDGEDGFPLASKTKKCISFS